MAADAETNGIPLIVPRTRARCKTLVANGLALSTPAALLPTYRGQLPHLPVAILPSIPGGVLALSIPASDFAVLNTKTGLCGGALAAEHPGKSLAALASLPLSLTFLTLRTAIAPQPTAHVRDGTVRVDARAARLQLTAAVIADLHKLLRTDFAECPSGTCSTSAKFASARAAEMAAAADPATLLGAARADVPAKVTRDAAANLSAAGFGGVSVAGLYAGESPRERREAVEVAADGAGDATVAVLGGDGEPGEVLRMVAAGADLLEARFPFEKATSGEAVDFERGVVLVVRDKQFARDGGPLVEGCECSVCCGFSRAYVHHLLDVHEMLAPSLLAVHNLHAYLKWFAEIRKAVAPGAEKFGTFCDAFFERRAKFRVGGISRGLMPL